MNFAIVQVRMGSHRLPGKVLLPLCGKPVLYRIIERLKYSKVDRIIVATSTNPLDDEIEKFCIENQFDYFRGDEENVLSRFLGCIDAKGIKDGDNIVRITGDCPCVDPSLIDELLTVHIKNHNGLTVNCCDDNWHGSERTYPNGLDLEIFRPSTLRNPHFNEINFFEIEYSPTFLKNKNFKVYNMKHHKDISYLWWTLDTPEDYERIKKIYDALYHEGDIFLMNDILSYLEVQ